MYGRISRETARQIAHMLRINQGVDDRPRHEMDDATRSARNVKQDIAPIAGKGSDVKQASLVSASEYEMTDEEVKKCIVLEKALRELDFDKIKLLMQELDLKKLQHHGKLFCTISSSAVGIVREVIDSEKKMKMKQINFMK